MLFLCSIRYTGDMPGYSTMYTPYMREISDLPPVLTMNSTVCGSSFMTVLFSWSDMVLMMNFLSWVKKKKLLDFPPVLLSELELVLKIYSLFS